MSYILSASSVQMPTTMEQDQLAVDLGITEVEGVVVHGKITDGENAEPIEGAIVKAFFTNPNTEELEGLTHTFSGCDGNYMLYIPPTVEIDDSENPGQKIDYPLAGKEIIIQAVGAENIGDPYECPEVPT
ncbi:hypothetical protein EDD65_10689 [Keratinibaculum paraultunense]|uniref:Carboxypeptidase family protein n=1 Tax=Keratinibaculum paraultunense TaxID=1278232 RepID=A0A4R3KV65_9FIRM|nr:hypothetical protein [Keratinibaculum paraultunense]QQY79290.1 hypothetical protein JL105_08850 [Keratinibaculum paraultunense]TCS89423.1 hypothetical protein EDD65_10689 [Keratinibaculum paraultunense]